MITMLYALGRVVGAEIGLLGYILCSLLYFGICFLIPQNRKRGKKRVWLGWIAAEILCDAAFSFCYFPGGQYMNRGLAGMFPCLLWPVLLFLTGLLVTAFQE